MNDDALERASRTLEDLDRPGARPFASDALAARIAADRLDAAGAESLASLVYGVLRNERRLVALLERLRGRAGGMSNDPRDRVVAFAVWNAELAPARAEVLRPGFRWAALARENELLLQASDPVTRVALAGSLPDWLAEELVGAYGDEAPDLAASLASAPARTLRVNTNVTDREALRSELVGAGARVEDGRYAPLALEIRGAFNPFRSESFHAGAFELQDEASQIVCELVAPPPRGLVVDACAGAGGKTLALAAALGGRGRVLALDPDARKLAELRRRAKRARAANVWALPVAPEGALPEEVARETGRAERVLIDAPCSGTGVLRRNPEARRSLQASSVARLAEQQRRIVERFLPLVAPGGRLVFATCSLLPAEGEAVLDAVERDHPEFSPVDLAEIYGRAYVDRFRRSAPHRLRLLPHAHGTDGFFVSVLRRRR